MKPHHRTGRPKVEPIYTLAHGIEVLSEWVFGRYTVCRIRPHPFFGKGGNKWGITVRRSRLMMSVKLGRRLLPSEHVHHKDENRMNDALDNLELKSPDAHNKHHKTGSKHSEETKRKIRESVKRTKAAK